MILLYIQYDTYVYIFIINTSNYIILIMFRPKIEVIHSYFNINNPIC